MNILVSKQHIQAARLSNGQRTPIELAIMDMDCFEEVNLKILDTDLFSLELDGNAVPLTQNARTNLKKYLAGEEIKSFSFELPVDDPMMTGGDDLLFESFDDPFGYSMSF